MTLNDEQRRELEANEQWLRAEDDLTHTPNADAWKLRTRLEANEQWLADRWADTIPSGLVDRAKARVHDELAATKGHAAPRPLRLWRWGAGVALAAAACLAIFVGVRVPESQTTQETLLLDAFEAYSQENLDETLATLGDEVSDLELAFVDRADDDAAVDVMYEMFDDVERPDQNGAKDNG